MDEVADVRGLCAVVEMVELQNDGVRDSAVNAAMSLEVSDEVRADEVAPSVLLEKDSGLVLLVVFAVEGLLTGFAVVLGSTLRVAVETVEIL